MEGGGGGVPKPLKDKTRLDIKISGPATPLMAAGHFCFKAECFWRQVIARTYLDAHCSLLEAFVSSSVKIVHPESRGDKIIARKRC
jgi:hypothetical protein